LKTKNLTPLGGISSCENYLGVKKELHAAFFFTIDFLSARASATGSLCRLKFKKFPSKNPLKQALGKGAGLHTKVGA